VFDRLVAKLGQGNLGGSFRDNQKDDPVFSSAIANNQILDATLSSGGAASIRVPAPIVEVVSGSMETVLQQIKDFATSVHDINEFKQAQDILQNLGGDVDQILNGIAAAMLRIVQGIAKFMLDGAQAVIDSLLGLVSTLADGLRRMLTADCDNIPFVSTPPAFSPALSPPAPPGRGTASKRRLTRLSRSRRSRNKASSSRETRSASNIVLTSVLIAQSFRRLPA
jgi:hypothetical protein